MPPSYAELVALVSVLSVQLSEQSRLMAGQAELLAEQSKLIEALRVELAALSRQAGRDSSNSSQPPSQDGPGARAKAKAGKGSGEPADTSTDGPSDSSAEADQGDTRKRKQGGQPGRRGSGLARVARPDRTEKVEPDACVGCGESLAGADGKVASSVQVFDLPALALTVTEYLMMARACGCGQVTTAPLPAGVRGGPACYGPHVTAAATWLASQDVIGIERAADMMSALLGVPVSTGFVSSCLARLDDALIAAGFEEALKAALCQAEVLGTDETPAPVTATGAAAEAAKTGQDISNPHVFTVRTMHGYTGGGPDLLWYGAGGTRTKKEITRFGILDNFAGILVRDDFGGYVSYDEDLTGVQQCVSHLLRHLQDVTGIDPLTQAWSIQAADALRLAIHAVKVARRDGTAVDPEEIAKRRKEFDQAVACGISVNLSRPWAKDGNNPGLKLAQPPQAQSRTTLALHPPP